MIKLALTGGIGAGKSTVCRIFSLLGAAIFNADEVAKSLYSRADLVSRISLAFGPAAVVEGKVDHKALAAIVFNDPQALKKLNQLVHPLVMEAYQTWLEQQSPVNICILESAIIFEAGLEQEFDHIICVSAPLELCLERIKKRDGVSEEKAMARMNAQLDPQIKKEKSTFVIVNDDQQMVLPQVIAIYQQLSAAQS